MESLKKNVKGITMLVLVVTIIVLLILAGIVITLLIGNDGLINRAKNATEKYKEAQENEQIEMDSLYSKLASIEGEGNISREDLKDVLQEILEEGYRNPTGMVISYMGNTAPEGYLQCNGETYNISEYSKLAEQIKGQFGMYNYFGGDGTTTFAVPNLENKFLKGSNNAGIAQEAGLPNITGYFTAYTYRDGHAEGPFRSQTSNVNVLSAGSKVDYNYNIFGFDASNSNAIYGKSGTVTPENMSVLYCIKY